MSSRIKEGLTKFHGEIEFTATGVIGPTASNPWFVGGENSLRIAIENVGGSNEVVVYGKIRNQAAFVTLTTITGGTTGTTVDISVIDDVYFECTVYSASGGTPKLVASGFVVPGSGGGGGGTVDQGNPNTLANAWPVEITDGTDSVLVTAAGELNVIASAQPGVDIGDVTVNNAGGASAVNIQDGGNSITVDGTVAATQSGTWVLGANSGVDIGDVTINNASGASAVNIQDGGNSITVDNAALSVVGGGTEATALRVTIANNSTGVLSVDDNGGSLTVDGTVAATQSGTWNINNVSGTVSLPTGAATLAEQQTQTASLSVLDDWDETDRAKVNPIVGQAGVQGGSGTVSANTQRVVLATDVGLPTGSNTIGTVNAQQSTASSLNAQVVGSGANGSAIGNPVTMAMQDLTTGLRAIPNTFPFSGAQFQLCLVPDLLLNFQVFNADGSANSRTGSPDGTLANAVYLATDSSRNQLIVGNIAHDATDSGNPIKIGGKTTSLTSEPTAVSAAGDRADAYFDTKGYQHVKSNAHRLGITTLHNAVTFNNTTTSSNSSSVDLSRYRYAKIFFVLTKAGSPTSISIVAQFSPDSGTTWCDYRDWEWSNLIYVANQIPLNECLALNAAGGALGSLFRLRAVASGTTAVNTITLTSYIDALT